MKQKILLTFEWNNNNFLPTIPAPLLHLIQRMNQDAGVNNDNVRIPLLPVLRDPVMMRYDSSVELSVLAILRRGLLLLNFDSWSR